MKKEDEIKLQKAAKCVYLGVTTDKVMDAIEKVFNKTTPTPTGKDMIEVLALAPVVLLARQIRMSCRSKETMQSVMRSSMLLLKNCIDEYAEPFMIEDEPWDSVVVKEGGKDGGTKS